MTRCLVVDDSPVFRDAACAVLTADGFEVVGTAATGDEALELVGSLRPSVVLLDVDLGDEDGFAIAERIRARAGAGLAVVMVSTRAALHYEDRLRDAPVAGFLPKEQLSGARVSLLVAGSVEG